MTMREGFAALALGALILLAPGLAPAADHDAPATHGSYFDQDPKAMFASMDADGDGLIRESEYLVHGTAAMFVKLDQDRSGALTLEEFKVEFAGKGGHGSL